jgi:hypothetical protein
MGTTALVVVRDANQNIVVAALRHMDGHPCTEGAELWAACKGYRATASSSSCHSCLPLGKFAAQLVAQLAPNHDLLAPSQLGNLPTSYEWDYVYYIDETLHRPSSSYRLRLTVHDGPICIVMSRWVKGPLPMQLH